MNSNSQIDYEKLEEILENIPSSTTDSPSWNRVQRLLEEAPAFSFKVQTYNQKYQRQEVQPEFRVEFYFGNRLYHEDVLQERVEPFKDSTNENAAIAINLAAFAAVMLEYQTVLDNEPLHPKGRPKIGHYCTHAQFTELVWEYLKVNHQEVASGLYKHATQEDIDAEQLKQVRFSELAERDIHFSDYLQAQQQLKDLQRNLEDKLYSANLFREVSYKVLDKEIKVLSLNLYITELLE